ncbi:luciferase [Frankia sp. R43]|uniref:LLM class F420-dependent oxidoreductase n=1 Tax=Frankia sp. R43 TaxID=269536 RepID=UPI0006CA55DF|nr:LLM class F420-dependent oxidoreductase [Frankia sp. R43]KPM55986.1 luciferase [Frankia sp. R43]
MTHGSVRPGHGPVRLGVVLPQAEIRPSDPRAVRRFVEHVEELGFDHLIAYDHVLGADSQSRPGWTGHYDHRTPFLEPLTLFAYLGATSSLELVTGVLVLPQRQTALVAKQAATVDLLLDGRLRLGVGIGWNEVEYEGLGVSFRSRAARLEEQIGLLRQLWTQPVVDHRGRFDIIDRAGVEPLPVQRPIPIWIGCGDAPTALERVGRVADGWIPHPALGGGSRLAAAWTAVRAAAERAGRDPATLGLQGQVRLTPGSLNDVTTRIDRWIELGATHVALNTLEAGLTWPADHHDLYTRIARAWRAR